MKGTVNGITTVYIGSYFEWTGSTSSMVSYYYAGGVRVSMRTGTTLQWLIGDHLGSTSVATDNSDAKTGGMGYKPWGEIEPATTWGTIPTKHRFTGQIEEASLGLYFFNARWLDSSLGRFIQVGS